MNSQPIPANRPRHIAIVMDGNGRWASRRYLPRIAGHKQGVSALTRCTEACLVRNIDVLTVFAFSSENWNRPAEEVSALMELLAISLAHEVSGLKSNGVQLHFIGNRGQLSARVREALASAESSTSDNRRMVLNVCFNYGGRWDIAQAAQALASRGEAITEVSLDRAMAMSHVGDPDLLIRTGGEYRLSNFLLWQAAYTELYFSSVLWPDFGESALDEAIIEFQKRERRFGTTGSPGHVSTKVN